MSTPSLVFAPPVASPVQHCQALQSQVYFPTRGTSATRMRFRSSISMLMTSPTQKEQQRVNYGAVCARRRKQSFLEAIDFSEVRSYQDAKLLSDAKFGKLKGGRMSQEQYGCVHGVRTADADVTPPCIWASGELQGGYARHVILLARTGGKQDGIQRC